MAAWLDETLPETLGFYALPEAEARQRLRTTNALEREHEEVRRRTRVIRIFPSEASFLRLACALAADRNDQWAKRRYVVPASPTTNVHGATRARRAVELYDPRSDLHTSAHLTFPGANDGDREPVT